MCIEAVTSEARTGGTRTSGVRTSKVRKRDRKTQQPPRDRTDDDFLKAFRRNELPPSEWTHEAHVRMAWLYLNRFSFNRALRKIRYGISSYNAAQKKDGYHETITTAFAHLIQTRLRSRVKESFAEFRKRNPDLFDRSLSPLLRHYSKETLFSAAAKHNFVEPDRMSFDGRAVNLVRSTEGKPEKVVLLASGKTPEAERVAVPA